MSSTAFFAASLLCALAYLVAPESWLLDAFGFREQPTEVLRDSVLLFCMAWAFAFAGHVIAGRAATEKPSPSVRRRAAAAPVLVFALLSVLIVGKILLAADSIGESALDERVFIDKLSQYILLSYGAACYLSLWRRSAAGRLVLETVLFITCFLIAVVDMSREALIPAAFVLAFYLQRPGHLGRLVTWATLTALLLVLVMIRRDFTLTDATQQQAEIVLVYLVEAVGYITAFNVFHFGQVVSDAGDTGFSLHYLILSVLPLPSSMIGAEVLESRNFDAFRPYGAAADLLSLSTVIFAAYWGLFGWVARKSTHSRGIVRVVLAALLFILFVTSFQYPLRTSSKFFILVIAVLSVRHYLRAMAGRTYGGGRYRPGGQTLGEGVSATDAAATRTLRPSVPTATT